MSQVIAGYELGVYITVVVVKIHSLQTVNYVKL